MGIHDYSDEYETRSDPTKGMYDYSDEFEILPDPTKGMHLKLFELFKDKELDLIRNFKKLMLAEVKTPRPWLLDAHPDLRFERLNKIKSNVYDRLKNFQQHFKK